MESCDCQERAEGTATKVHVLSPSPTLRTNTIIPGLMLSIDHHPGNAIVPHSRLPIAWPYQAHASRGLSAHSVDGSEGPYSSGGDSGVWLYGMGHFSLTHTVAPPFLCRASLHMAKSWFLWA